MNRRAPIGVVAFAVLTLSVCVLSAAPAFGYLYVLKHPKHEHCRVHYARTQRTINEHGHRVNQTICVWVTIPKPKPAPTHSAPPQQPRAWCEASAEYSSEYKNWEIFVHSNQPYQSAKVRGGGGEWSYETNSSGYADVYLYVNGDSTGQQVRVEVGEATCSTTLE